MSAVAELIIAGHEVRLWNRSADALAPLQAAGRFFYAGVLGDGHVTPALMTSDIKAAIATCDAAVVTLPTFAHASLASLLADSGWPVDRPIVLNPGHTGGALEFVQAFGTDRTPPIAELSTLTYVARKHRPDCVTTTGRAGAVRAAALPGGEAALAVAESLFPGVARQADVIATSLANVNMILHPPGAILGAAWIEARQGDFTFYVDAMTSGVGRVMQALDDERRAVARAFGHDLPGLLGEMRLIGTVEADTDAGADFATAIAGGKANSKIKAPSSLAHRYYREDFGHGLLPFIEIADIAGVKTPTATSLLALAQTLGGIDYRATGRTAVAMGIAGMTRDELIQHVRLK